MSAGLQNPFSPRLTNTPLEVLSKYRVNEFKGGDMNQQAILYGIIGVLLGSIITIFAASYAVNNHNQGVMNMMGMHNSRMMSDDDMSMKDMADALKNKTDDEFDKLFINEMIEHHQGAIDMANHAKQNAKHDEIKQLADDIINTQTKEINQMKLWQTSWGYPSSTGSGSSSVRPYMMEH